MFYLKYLSVLIECYAICSRFGRADNNIQLIRFRNIYSLYFRQLSFSVYTQVYNLLKLHSMRLFDFFLLNLLLLLVHILYLLKLTLPEEEHVQVLQHNGRQFFPICFIQRITFFSKLYFHLLSPLLHFEHYYQCLYYHQLLQMFYLWYYRKSHQQF